MKNKESNKARKEIQIAKKQPLIITHTHSNMPTFNINQSQMATQMSQPRSKLIINTNFNQDYKNIQQKDKNKFLQTNRSKSSSCFYSENNQSDDDEDNDSSFGSNFQDTPDLRPQKIDFHQDSKSTSVFGGEQFEQDNLYQKFRSQQQDLQQLSAQINLGLKEQDSFETKIQIVGLTKQQNQQLLLGQDQKIILNQDNHTNQKIQSYSNKEQRIGISEQNMLNMQQFSTDFSQPSNPSIINPIQAMSILTTNQSHHSNMQSSQIEPQLVSFHNQQRTNTRQLTGGVELNQTSHFKNMGLASLPLSGSNKNAVNQKHQKIINQSVLSQQNLLQGNRYQSTSIMMDSISLIQKSRANFINGSNAQSIRETIISSQNQELSSQKNNTPKISEIPSEYKSISDIHEVLEVQETSSDLIDETQKKDKNIFAKSEVKFQQQQQTQIVTTPSLLKNPEGIANFASKFIVRPSVKSIRQTPQFKGIDTVLKTASSTKNATAKKNKFFHTQRYCETQVDNSSSIIGQINQQNNGGLQESISTTSLQPLILNTTANIGELRIKNQNSPIVITSKDKPNVYRIIGRESSCDERKRLNKNKFAQQLTITPKNVSTKQKHLIEGQFPKQYESGIKNLKTYSNEDFFNHNGPISQQKPRNQQLFSTGNVNLQSLSQYQNHYQNNDYQNKIKSQKHQINPFPIYQGCLTTHQSPKAFFDQNFNGRRQYFEVDTQLRISTQPQKQINNATEQQIRAKQNLIFQPQYVQNQDMSLSDRFHTDPNCYYPQQLRTSQYSHIQNYNKNDYSFHQGHQFHPQSPFQAQQNYFQPSQQQQLMIQSNQNPLNFSLQSNQQINYSHQYDIINQSDLNEGVVYVDGGVGKSKTAIKSQNQHQNINNKQQHVVRFEDHRQIKDKMIDLNKQSQLSSKKQMSRYEKQKYFFSDPIEQIAKENKARKSLLDEQEKYLKALKKRQLGDGFHEPILPSSECEDDEDDYPIFPKNQHQQNTLSNHHPQYDFSINDDERDESNLHFNQPPKIFLTQERMSQVSKLTPKSASNKFNFAEFHDENINDTQRILSNSKSKQYPIKQNKQRLVMKSFRHRSGTEVDGQQSENFTKDLKKETSNKILQEDSKCIIM